MTEGERGRPRAPGRRLRRVSSSLVVLVLVAGAAAHVFALGPRWFGWDYPSPVDEPAEVAPPPGLELPETEDPGAVAEAVRPAEVDADAVRRALTPALGDRDLGRRVAVAVAPALAGEPVFRVGPSRVTPASTLKLVTGVAVLHELGPDHQFDTRALTGPGGRQVFLVGGGDPLLASRPASSTTYPSPADVATLARATARVLADAGRERVRLRYDDTLFAGPSDNPAWEPSYVPDGVVTPISALWADEGLVDGGVARSPDPASEAARVMAAVLEARGIEVQGGPRPGQAPDDAEESAAVSSPPLAQLVAHMLETSDNEAAEVLARHVALARGGIPSFVGGSRAVVASLEDLGVDMSGDRVLDGSGLARGNRLRPETLLAVLRLTTDRPRLRAVMTGLPVAGFTGSLAFRFETGPALGRGAVRAKTGTLSGVHGLAGLVVTRDGAVLDLVAVADRVRLVDTLDAREALDRAAAALAACRCAAS